MIILKAETTKPIEGGPSFALSNRIFRGIWMLVWILFVSWTPAPLHQWRALLLRLFGAKIHRTARVYGRVKVWYPPFLEMQEYSCLGPGVNCYSMAKIFIGPRVVVSQGVHLCAGSHDIHDPNFQLITRPIAILDGAWVAAEAFIGPGVTVGAQAVIGARAVLFKDAEERGIYVGNPAVLIRRRRFNDEE